MSQYHNLDAAETIYFSREIEQVRSKTYDVKYPNFKARQLIPVDNSVDPGAVNVSYTQYDLAGQAKIIANYADDLPRVDVKGKDFFAPIRSLGDSYGYSLQEIRTARFAGTPLQQRKANAARIAIEQKIDQIAAVGDAANGLLGMTNQPNAVTYTVPNGAGGTATWATKTGAEIVKDLNGIANAIISATKGAEVPNTLLVPTAQYALLSATPYSTNVPTPILKFFLDSSPNITSVEPWYVLTGAGAGPTDRMIAYRRDPDAIQLVIPQEFEQLPPEPRGLEIVVACHARIGGVILYYPMSMAYGDGI